MKRTSKTLLQFADREPYQPITELIDAPAALLEIITLTGKAEKGDADAVKNIKALAESVFRVVLADPEALLKLEQLGLSGYRIAFLPTETTVPAIA